jgi:hypothetical protein
MMRGEDRTMAMGDFLRNVQTARNLILSHVLAHPGRDPLPPGVTGANLTRTAQVWLSPQVIAGFDPNDFGFLSPDQRERLANAVSGVREIAEAVAGRVPTPEEARRGYDLLVEIIALLDDKLLDAEGKALMQAIHAAKKPFPDFVLGFDYTLDTDSTGDPAIWIWVLVPDDLDPDSNEFREFTSQFRRAVRTALAEVKSERIPYIHYRPLTEAVELMSEGVA